MRGFENAASIKTLIGEDYKELETFARTKMEKYIPPDAKREDYYHIFSKEPYAFEIVPGHIKLLNQAVEHIKSMTASSRNLGLGDAKPLKKHNFPSLVRQIQDRGKYRK